MDLDTLIDGLPIVRTSRSSSEPVRICDLTEDSRSVMPGSLFIARKGEKSDGRAFIAPAVYAGAVAVMVEQGAAERGSIHLPRPSTLADEPVLLVTPDIALATAHLAERFYASPTRRLALAGVTGTNGKTTITFLIHQLLNAAPRAQGGARCGLIGTVCVDDGSETAPASLTTPPALELSRTFARMVDAGCTAAAMEVSSHALHQRRAAALAFKVGVFTNLTHDHLDYHGTMEAYAEAKAMLFAMLPPATEGGVAVLNADDPASAMMADAARARGADARWCSTDPARESDPSIAWHARVLEVGPRTTRLRVRVALGPAREAWDIDLPLVGDHNAMNALQAAAAAHALGLSLGAVRDGLSRVAAPPGRLEPVTPIGAPFAVYVDYAHTDDALARVLNVARAALPRGGLLRCVFGCGGDRDPTKRPKMGRAAAALSDQAFITSDNPRSEDPLKIISHTVAGVAPSDRAKVTVEPDRRAAIVAAIAAAKPGDIVLIAGKGHEDYQIVAAPSGGTVKLPFDDRAVAREALAHAPPPSPRVRTRARAGTPAHASSSDAAAAPRPPRQARGKKGRQP